MFTIVGTATKKYLGCFPFSYGFPEEKFTTSNLWKHQPQPWYDHEVVRDVFSGSRFKKFLKGSQENFEESWAVWPWTFWCESTSRPCETDADFVSWKLQSCWAIQSSIIYKQLRWSFLFFLLYPQNAWVNVSSSWGIKQASTKTRWFKVILSSDPLLKLIWCYWKLLDFLERLDWIAQLLHTIVLKCKQAISLYLIQPTINARQCCV